MRTTLTIDDDCYERLLTLSRKQGCSLRDAVNTTLRRGLEVSANPKPTPYRQPTFKTGPLPGINLDDISALLDQIEGPNWR